MKNEKGFTLIELVVCVMILIIISLVATQMFFGIAGYMNFKNSQNNTNDVVIIQQQDEEVQNESRY